MDNGEGRRADPDEVTLTQIVSGADVLTPFCADPAAYWTANVLLDWLEVEKGNVQVH